MMVRVDFLNHGLCSELAPIDLPTAARCFLDLAGLSNFGVVGCGKSVLLLINFVDV